MSTKQQQLINGKIWELKWVSSWRAKSKWNPKWERPCAVGPYSTAAPGEPKGYRWFNGVGWGPRSKSPDAAYEQYKKKGVICMEIAWQGLKDDPFSDSVVIHGVSMHS